MLATKERLEVTEFAMEREIYILGEKKQQIRDI